MSYIKGLVLAMVILAFLLSVEVALVVILRKYLHLFNRDLLSKARRVVGHFVLAIVAILGKCLYFLNHNLLAKVGRVVGSRGEVRITRIKSFVLPKVTVVFLLIVAAIVSILGMCLHFFPHSKTTPTSWTIPVGVLLALIAIGYLIFRIFSKGKEVMDFTEILKKIGSLHVVRMFALLLLSYLIVMGISKTFFDTMYDNTLLFWVVTIGALFVVAIFKIERPRALIITLVGVYLLHMAGMIWSPLAVQQRASAQQTQERVKEKIVYRFGDYDIMAPPGSCSEITYIPTGAKWQFDSGPYPIKIVDMGNNGAIYQLGKDADVRMPEPPLSLCFQSVTGENTVVHMRVAKR